MSLRLNISPGACCRRTKRTLRLSHMARPLVIDVNTDRRFTSKVQVFRKVFRKKHDFNGNFFFHKVD